MAKQFTWQLPDWPKFTYDTANIVSFNLEFSHWVGVSIGIQKALDEKSAQDIRIEFLSDEALNTSRIEGELLDKVSLQSSIQRYFQLKAPLDKQKPRENGIANMMVNLYHQFAEPLSHDMLYAWHHMLMNGRTDLEAIGRYRFHEEPMQIVSRGRDIPTVHYKAPPSKQVKFEMTQFIEWFNSNALSLPPLIHAGIAHAYFELIHPFEDGNGRIGRALIEKSLATSLGYPTLFAISKTVQKNKTSYYNSLDSINQSIDLTEWLTYFCQMVIQAQQNTVSDIEFFFKKSRFFAQFDSQLNQRQYKLIRRIFETHLDGFEGGVSVKNYMKIAKTSSATAYRDLNNLVEKGIMRRTGEYKTTRYWLKFYDSL